MSDTTTDVSSYPVDDVNRVKRRHDRGHYDHKTVHALLDSGMLCHVAYVIDGRPFCTPTSYWREGSRLYWHGSAASRMLRNLEKGEPACLTVTHLDALVLARAPFNHAVDYRSVMAFGNARLVEDQEEKEQALVMMVDRLYPGRTESLRQSTRQEIKGTSVVYMDIERVSAKIRARGVVDEDEDWELPIYAEVIPVKQVLGEPVQCPRLVAGVERHPSARSYVAGRTLEDALLESYEACFPEAELS